MSRMYAAAALSQKQVPTTLPELFKQAAKPIKSWWEPAKVSTIPDNATLLEYGLVSDFTRDWALSKQRQHSPSSRTNPCETQGIL